MKIGSYLLTSFVLCASATVGNGGGVRNEDPIDNWIDHPDQRNPELHLAFVEIVSIADEKHTLMESPNSKVSDDDGKTWYNLLNVRSGMATLRVVECPDVEMPVIITEHFERSQYVPTTNTPTTDRIVKPGARLLGFFAQQEGQWILKDGNFIDPVPYLLTTSYAKRLQALFEVPLSDEKTLTTRKREYDEAFERTRQRAVTNHDVDKK